MGAGVTVTSITGASGSDYDMCYKVAKALKTKLVDLTGATAIITRGDFGVFADAIGVAPLACAQKWPIIFASSATGPLPAKSIQALSELGITKALKVGNYCTLPAGVAGVDNLSGADRFATCVKVAEWSHAHAGLLYTHLGIAPGDQYPDALAAGPYLALDSGTLLLSWAAGPVPAVVTARISANWGIIHHVSFIGVADAVITQVKALLP
jgi:membrane-associated protease RseP (regulator of RpoE activity)